MKTSSSVSHVVTVNNAVFKRSIAALADIAGGRRENTPLGCIRMKMEAGLLLMEALGEYGDLKLRLEVDGAVETGALLIPSMRFARFVAALPDSLVGLSLMPGVLRITCADVKLNVSLLDSQTPWYERPREPGAIPGQLDSALLLDALRVQYALDSVHAVFKGLALTWSRQSGATRLLVYATNGMVAAVVDQETKSELDGAVLLHPQGLKPLEQFLRVFSGTSIEATLERSSLYLDAGGNVLRMGLLDARPMPLTKPLSGSVLTTSRVHRSTLLASLKRLDCYAEEEGSKSRLVQISTGVNDLILTAKMDEGQVIDSIFAQTYGTVANMKLSVSTLNHAVQAAQNEDILLEFISDRLRISEGIYTAVIMKWNG